VRICPFYHPEGRYIGRVSPTGRIGSDRPERPRISAVIPTLNEASNLPHVLTRIPDMVDEVVLVDGRSIDDTVAVAQMIRPDIRVVLQDGSGKGNALACGFAVATGDIIVTLDADGSTDPAEIPSFVDALLDDGDYAKGSRYLDGGGSVDLTRVRSFGNVALTRVTNLLFRTRYTDLTYGYNAFWADCLSHLHVNSGGFEGEVLIHVRAGRAKLRIREVPSMEHERIFGESKLNALRDGVRILRMIVRERLRIRAVRPVRSDAFQPTYVELKPGGSFAELKNVEFETVPVDG
jgi:glycosyltransferase involved in cell wall biosynthesis